MRREVKFEKQILQGQNVHQPKWQRIILLTVLGYEAAGGVLGGALLITAPDGRLMSMPTEMMHGVFPDFLIPGFILLGLGILNGIAFGSVLRRFPTDWLMAGLALGGFVVWFVVEIIILQELHWLHLMWGLPVLLGWLVLIPIIVMRNSSERMQNALYACGIFSSAWYVAINIFVPTQYEGYSVSTLTVSEMSAIGSPTRILWVLLVIPYPLLLAAFGWGILRSARSNRVLRIAGSLIIAYCIFNLYWPPMHQRGVEPTITDTLHIAWAMVTMLSMIALMVLGAIVLDVRFRIYTILSIVVLMVFGILTSLDAPEIPRNGPTPLMGVWERINIGVLMVWVAVFALALRKRTIMITLSPFATISWSA